MQVRGMIRSLRATRLRTSGSDQKTSAIRTIYATACLTVLLAGQANSATVASSIENLNCKSGPVARTYGKTKWLVYGWTTTALQSLLLRRVIQHSPSILGFRRRTKAIILRARELVTRKRPIPHIGTSVCSPKTRLWH